MRIRRTFWEVLALAVTLQAGAADAAVVALKNAWMRPAAAGMDSVEAYVDIVSDSALELIAASTPIARAVEIVTVAATQGTAGERAVASYPVAAAATTRLAYRGDHLRLKDIQRSVGNGDPVTLILTFTDAAGNTVLASTEILVRGLLRPQQMPNATRSIPNPSEFPVHEPGTAAPGM